MIVSALLKFQSGKILSFYFVKKKKVLLRTYFFILRDEEKQLEFFLKTAPGRYPAGGDGYFFDVAYGNVRKIIDGKYYMNGMQNKVSQDTIVIDIKL